MHHVPYRCVYPWLTRLNHLALISLSHQQAKPHGFGFQADVVPWAALEICQNPLDSSNSNCSWHRSEMQAEISCCKPWSIAEQNGKFLLYEVI